MKIVRFFWIAGLLISIGCSNENDLNRTDRSSSNGKNIEILERNGDKKQPAENLELQNESQVMEQSQPQTKINDSLEDFPIPAMSIRTDISNNIVFIEGGLESKYKDAYLRDLAQNAIDSYKFAKDSYPVSVADDFENGIETYHSSQPKTMIIHYQVSVYNGPKKVNEIIQKWIAGTRNETYFSELLE